MKKLMASMSNTTGNETFTNTNSVMHYYIRWDKDKAASFSPVTLETNPQLPHTLKASSLAVYHKLYKTETIQEYEKKNVISVHVCVSAGVDMYHIHLGLYRSQRATDSLKWQL